jgi:hypothetical protein
MTTEATQTDEAKKIWALMDAEDSNASVAVEPADIEDIQADSGQVAATAAPQTDKADNPDEADANDAKALINKIAGLESMVGQLTGRLRNAEGHIGGLNSQVKTALDAAKAKAVSAGDDAPSAKEIRDAQGDPGALAKLSEEYPEFAKHLTPALEATNSRIANLEKQLKDARDATAAQPAVASITAQDLDARDAAMAVEIKHPGWKNVVKQAEFHGFVATAPREVRLLASSDDPQDAIRLMDLYAESTAERPSTTQRNQRLASAAALPTGQRSTAKTKSVDEMSGSEYWRYLDQLDKQKG